MTPERGLVVYDTVGGGALAQSVSQSAIASSTGRCALRSIPTVLLRHHRRRRQPPAQPPFRLAGGRGDSGGASGYRTLSASEPVRPRRPMIPLPRGRKVARSSARQEPTRAAQVAALDGLRWCVCHSARHRSRAYRGRRGRGERSPSCKAHPASYLKLIATIGPMLAPITDMIR